MLFPALPVLLLPFCYSLSSFELPGGARHLSIEMAVETRIHRHYSPFLRVDETDGDRFDPSTTAMVILNSPIRRPPSPLFEKLWAQSSFRICADGGANRLFHATKDSEQVYRPDLITGDLDSLKADTRDFFERMKVNIVKEYDQDFNDLDKSIGAIPETYQTCFVYGAFGGRFDQEIASIQALFVHLDKVGQIWLFDDRNASILLKPGAHRIYCPNFGLDSSQRVLGEGPTCGLIPIGHPCAEVTTSGLRWNLDAQSLEFGGLVSTSNRITEKEVSVRCSHPLLFTVEVDSGVDTDELW
jgi:thiamine pyrophosphokinase